MKIILATIAIVATSGTLAVAGNKIVCNCALQFLHLLHCRIIFPNPGKNSSLTYTHLLYLK
jgi:hypothetical protein